MEGCRLDSTGSGQGPVVGCCECGDEPLGSCATELVIIISPYRTAGSLQKHLRLGPSGTSIHCFYVMHFVETCTNSESDMRPI
jgi:hypothetical protein